MKKIISVLIFILIFFTLQLSVLASGSIAPSPKSLSIKKGSTGTFTIYANNACGKVSVYSSNTSVATVNVSSKWVENDSTTLTVTGVSAGTAYITVALSDAATFDEEPLSGSYTVTVTVTDSQPAVTNSTPKATTNTTQKTTPTIKPSPTVESTPDSTELPTPASEEATATPSPEIPTSTPIETNDNNTTNKSKDINIYMIISIVEAVIILILIIVIVVISKRK